MRGQCPAGEKFGRYTVLSLDTESKAKGTMWLCQCECGTVKSVNASNLRRGLSRSCGCLQKELQSARQLVDRTGHVNGRLTVIRHVGYRGDQALWTCKCKCGREVNITSGELRPNGTLSCGCLQKEKARENSQTHGLTKSKEYRSWTAMKARCTNENRDSFVHYGGRGVKICARWLNSFENFYADMGKAPSEYHSIERKNTNGDYTPDNCHWATQTEQCRNKRNNKMVTYRGNTMSLAELAEKTGVRYDLLQSRISRGWSVEKAVNH